MDLLPAAILAGSLLLLLLGALAAATLLYRRVGPDRALVISSANRDPRVVFGGAFVFPILHHAEEIALGVRPVTIERKGSKGISCRDGIRADMRLTFLFRVNPTQHDILQVARVVGCARASDPEVLRQLFEAKVSEAVEATAKRLDFEHLIAEQERFREEIFTVIGQDLHGFVLNDLAIDQLDQTPIVALDPDNFLDAQGIRKITEKTARENAHTNEIKKRELVDIARKNQDAALLKHLEQQMLADIEAAKIDPAPPSPGPPGSTGDPGATAEPQTLPGVAFRHGPQLTPPDERAAAGRGASSGPQRADAASCVTGAAPGSACGAGSSSRGRLGRGRLGRHGRQRGLRATGGRGSPAGWIA
jgi:uncharacterized membrane protein YqiK